MTDSNIPRLKPAEISLALEEYYHLCGELRELPSYSDLNFRLMLNGGDRYMVKVANSAIPLNSIDMQNAAMMHLADENLPIPKVIKNLDGKGISSIKSEHGETYILRVLSYLPGSFYADTLSENQSKNLWKNLGRFIGQVDSRLAKFSHQGAHRYLEWDLTQGFAVCQSKKYLLNDEQSELVDEILRRYQIEVMPRLRNLPKGIIHNDANDYNLLVDDVDKPTKITGLIDFGDMVYSHVINELAITCAYAIMGQNEPLKVVKQVTSAYHQERPLINAEVEVLLHLIGLRLCTTLCNSAEAILNEPDNDYLLVSVKPAIDALKNLEEINFYAANLQLIKACNLDAGSTGKVDASAKIINARQQQLAGSLSVSYQQPLNIVSGDRAYLYDEQGRQYLDMVNNVCHVGHCHPKVVAAGQKQMAILNTNTRFLHANLVDYSKRLLDTFPPELSVCLFVNSGSEANELAFRLAQCFTKRKELLVVDGAYHGNTSRCIDASPYKFEGKGGGGQASYIYKVALPDPYRGKFVGNTKETAKAYADDLDRVIEQMKSENKKPGAFICESLQGVAGQIIMPDGYLKLAYEKVRAAGGVCIADEVQVGFGRVGSHMWAFETQGVVPDIVTLGKPIGNGHPMAAVVMKREIAEAFNNGMEFFNTFGGNPVSCAIGMAVLDVIEEQNLMNHALKTGEYLRGRLLDLAEKCPLIGDVRGLGLFVGVELVENRETKEPATEKMAWLIEFFKRHFILLSSEGRYHNILKIKPPIVFTTENVDQFIEIFEKGLFECG